MKSKPLYIQWFNDKSIGNQPEVSIQDPKNSYVFRVMTNQLDLWKNTT